jgi:hypothetical protein
VILQPIDRAKRLSLLPEHRSPKVVARLNDYKINVVTVPTEFTWHTHDDSDKSFSSPEARCGTVT